MKLVIRIRKMQRSEIVSVTRIHRNTIRKVNAKDYSAKAIDAWAGRKSAKGLRAKFDTEQRFVAIIDDQIVGFMNITIDSKELMALYVRQGFVGRGVGSSLFTKAEEIIRASGAKSMTVESTITARSFYERHGLRVVKSTAVDMGGVKIPVFIMRKQFR